MNIHKSPPVAAPPASTGQRVAAGLSAPPVRASSGFINRTFVAATVAALLGAFMILRIVDSYDEFSATADEGNYLVCGIELYQRHTAVLGPQQPPLSRWAIGLLPYLSGLRFESGRSFFDEGKRLLEEAGDYWQTLTLARAGNLIFVPLLLFYVYHWASHLYGRTAGIVAVFLVCFSPAVIAHAGVASADLAVTAALTMAAFHASQWFRDRTMRNACWAGVGAGLALSAKFSALGYLPVTLAGYGLLAAWARRSWPWENRPLTIKPLVYQVSLAAGIAFTLLWATYGFDLTPLRHLTRMPEIELGNYVSSDSVFGQTADYVSTRMAFPMQSFFAGIVQVFRHFFAGHGAFQIAYGQFLLGEVKWDGGWWYYFPVALAVKTTLPFLALSLLALVSLWRGRREATCARSLFVVWAMVSILAVAMSGSLNIGVRHILPIYPLMAILASSFFRRNKNAFLPSRLGMSLAGLLLAGHAAASLGAHPDYLAYFNETARGKEHELLGDSNLDWGQDLARLGHYVQQHEIEDLSLSYFGPTSPEVVGIKSWRRFSTQERPRGWVAVSVLHLQGIYRDPNGDDFSWLADHTPYAKIGKSIWLYRFE
jgi:hypothetical protein